MGGRGREGGETDGEVWRLRYEISSSGDCTHTFPSHSREKREECNQTVKWLIWEHYWRFSGVSLLVVVAGLLSVCLRPCPTVGTGSSRSGWSDCSSQGSYTLYTVLAGTLPLNVTANRGTIWWTEQTHAHIHTHVHAHIHTRSSFISNGYS